MAAAAATTTTSTPADPPEAPMPRIVVEEPLEEPAAASPPSMGPGPGAATALVLLLTMLWLAWDASRRRKWRQQQEGADRMHPARRERLEAEERERRRAVDHEARRLAALRAQRFAPSDSSAKKPPAIPDADLLAGRRPFPMAALPPTASVAVPASSPPAVDPAAYMVCAPLDTVEELLAWRPPTAVLGPAAFVPPYAPPPRTVQHEALRRGQLLVCHDMKGGYHADRHCFGPNCPWDGGTGGGAAFRLYQFDLVDTFVYFSHSFITIPPPGWTALCHLNGARVLGTFITEWDAGTEKCRHVFESEETVARCVEQMVALAVHHGFEGWLINIENPVEWEGGTGLVVAFLELLTRRMKEALPAPDAGGPSPALVLWYDSVTHDTGELKWQDALNERNEAFFRASDGIFTNYCWKEDEPARSAARAEAAAAAADGGRSRRWDVFMGIDCFGRNTYGGGGFDCDVALRAIRQAGVSAALFAPGWVWEDQVERARRRALGEEEGVGREDEKEGEGEGETKGAQQEQGEGSGEAPVSGGGGAASAASVVEREEWDWRRVEAEFEATQERFWAKIGAMWPRRPLPADLSKPFVTNFGTGVGLHVWAGGVRVTPAFTFAANASSSPSTGAGFAAGPKAAGGGEHVTPFYNLAMQDALPLALTHCSRAAVKQPPPKRPNATTTGGGGRVSGRIGDDDDQGDTPPPCPAALGASTSYRTAYRGGSSLCVSGLLHPGLGATRATLPLYALDAPAPALALEVRAVYKAPHGLGEDDFCLELVLQGEGVAAGGGGGEQSPSSSVGVETVGAMGRLRGALAATSIATHVILRPGEEAEGGSSSSSSSWGSRRVGKTLETAKGAKRTRKIFFAPVSDAPVGAAGTAAEGDDADVMVMTSAQALAATVARARGSSQGPAAVALSLENVYDQAALEALPWRQRVFRVRDLALEGARVKELRLVCLKKPLHAHTGASSDDDDPLPLPYCLFVGELSLGQVRKPPAPPTLAPSAAPPRAPGPSGCLLLDPADGAPALQCQRLELRAAHWDAASRRLSGQVAWGWAWAAEGQQGGDPGALVADTDVLLFFGSGLGSAAPIWVGRTFTAAFALSIALPEGAWDQGVRLVLQPRDRLGSVVPLCSCSSLSVELQA